MKETNLLSKTMNHVIKALNDVPEKFYSQPKAKLILGKLVVQENESNSESTFSHHLQPLIEELFVKNKYHIDKKFETEIPKSIIFRNEDKRDTYGPTFNELYGREDKEDQEFYAIPDIVIHAGNDDFEKKNQLFVGELKTNQSLTPALFNIDLFKTAVYHDDLLFSYSAFIIINVTVKKVREMFRAYLDRGYFLPRRRGMYIIIKPDFQSTAKVYIINERQQSNIHF